MSRSLGVDLHPESIQVMTLDPKTCKAELRGMAVEEKALQAFEQQLRPDDRIALEATTNAYYFYDRWKPMVAEVVIANPIKLRPMLAHEDKSDRNDAFWLAVLNQFGLLPTVSVPDHETRDARELVNHRADLVRERTRCQNQIRALLIKHGLISPAGDLKSVDARDLVVRQHARLSQNSKLVLNSLLAKLDSAQARLDSVDAAMIVRANQHPDTPLLLTLPGIELGLAFTMLAGIGDIGRFPTAGSLVKYAGLVPKEKSSGGKFYRAGIRRTGSRSLRWAASVAARSAIKQPGRFQNLYRRLRRKGEGIAITACARKLLTIVWHILTKREGYREEDDGLKKRKETRVRRKVARAQAKMADRRAQLEHLLKHAPALKELSGGRSGFPVSLRLPSA